MAQQISINTEVAAQIYSYATNEVVELRDRLAKLDQELNKLFSEGEWRGVAADKFLSEYDGVKDVIVKQVPDALEQISENLNKNLQNLIEADSAGA
jgi:WXG100 family type VII secretion target